MGKLDSPSCCLDLVRDGQKGVVMATCLLPVAVWARLWTRGRPLVVWHRHTPRARSA